MKELMEEFKKIIKQFNNEKKVPITEQTSQAKTKSNKPIKPQNTTPIETSPLTEGKKQTPKYAHEEKRNKPPLKKETKTKLDRSRSSSRPRIPTQNRFEEMDIEDRRSDTND